MANAKIMLFDSPSKQKKKGTFPVCLKITHLRKRKYISLGKDALPNQWNTDSCRFRKNYPNHTKENQVLLKLEARAEDIIRGFTIDEVAFDFGVFETKFLKRDKPNDLEVFFNHCINQFLEAGKIGTASPYKTTLNAILDFATMNGSSNGKLKLSDISYKFLTGFEHWLRTDRMCKDTSISVYMRTLRAAFNRAIKEGIIKRDSYPFEKYRITERLKTQTPKRAIDKSKVKEIEALSFKAGTKKHFAQNIFLFSYYARGMNFVDIANLTDENIIDDRLIYTRQKTGKPFSIKLLPQAQSIIDYYRENRKYAGQHIFPVFDETLHQTPEQQFHRRKTVLREINRNLKKIAEIVGLEGLKLTSYVSRHTYATTLKKAGVNTAIISEAMGHSSEKVTQTYLKSFENTELDEANDNIL